MLLSFIPLFPVVFKLCFHFFFFVSLGSSDSSFQHAISKHWRIKQNVRTFFQNLYFYVFFYCFLLVLSAPLHFLFFFFLHVVGFKVPVRRHKEALVHKGEYQNVQDRTNFISSFIFFLRLSSLHSVRFPARHQSALGNGGFSYVSSATFLLVTYLRVTFILQSDILSLFLPVHIFLLFFPLPPQPSFFLATSTFFLLRLFLFFLPIKCPSLLPAITFHLPVH